jgi:hypothetical protein
MFKPWNEEERRAHIRTKNNAYQKRKEDHISLTEKRVKDQERQKKIEQKDKLEAGEWVSTGKAKTKKKIEKTVITVNAKNGFSALDSDEEEEKKEEIPYVRKKINWAEDSDDE